MRLRKRYLTLAGVLGVVLAMLPAAASSGTSPTIEAFNSGIYTHYWLPSQASVATGGLVTLRNSTAVAHGVEWVGGPAKPECESGVPVGTTAAASGAEWSGDCKFTKPGTYTFYCTVHGPEMTGTITVTTPGAPIATTGVASAVSQTEATLNGTVDRQGKATSYYFNYGTSASYGEKTTEQAAAEVSGGQPVSAQIGSLLPGTTYHYQVVAKNASGTIEGSDRTFTTSLPPGMPSATTDPATALTETTGTLNGTVDPNGETTTYFFEWGTGSQYGQSTEELQAGADFASHGVSAPLTGLTADTVYHFRLVAKNASGTAPGADQVFTTASPAPPAPPAPPVMPPPSPTPPVLTQSLVPPAPGTTATKNTVEAAPESPVAGAPSLRHTQHGTSVKGSLGVSAAGSGGRLEVDLYAKGASIAKLKTSASVRVGRLLRNAVPAGTVPFVVKLDSAGARALERHRTLALSLKITLTPKSGAPVVVTRGVVLER